MLDNEAEALKRFSDAHAADANVNPPEVSMAAMTTSAGRFEDAAKWYEKAEKNYPNDGSVRFEHGVGLLLAGRFAEAQAAFAKANELNTRLERYGASVPLMQGYGALGINDFAAAEQLFTKALEMSPGDFSALRYLSLAQIEQKDQEKRDHALELATA